MIDNHDRGGNDVRVTLRSDDGRATTCRGLGHGFD
jgi:hypothetical protein